MKIDFHTHTYHSYDSWMRPEKILRIAKERGLDGIVICDHDTIKGGIEVSQLNDDPNMHVIIGAEIKTDIGDVTGIFLEREIQSRSYKVVCSEIREQGGFTILNHPYEDHNLKDLDFSCFDFIEGYNGRLTAEKNAKAVALANLHKIPIVGGSDSHLYNEIANVFTTINSLESMIPIDHSVKRTKTCNLYYSKYIRAIKERNLKLALSMTKRAIYSIWK